MGKHIIPNPPSPEAAQALMKCATKTRKIQITPLVREAVRSALSTDHYEESMTYFMGGRITGSKLADGYAFARKVVEWEVESGGSIALQAALERQAILLNDIVKRIPAEMRKLNFAGEGWVCTGTLLAHIGQEKTAMLEAVNG